MADAGTKRIEAEQVALSSDSESSISSLSSYKPFSLPAYLNSLEPLPNTFTTPIQSRKRKTISPLHSIPRSSIGTPPKPPQKLIRKDSPVSSQHSKDEPVGSRPATDDIDEVLTSLEESVTKAFAEAREKILNIMQGRMETGRFMYNRSLQTLLAACGDEIPFKVRKLIHLMLGEEPPCVDPPSTFTLPKYDHFYSFCHDLSKQNIKNLVIGNLNDLPLIASLTGRVVCVGDGDLDVAGEGVMNIVLSPTVIQHIDVMVLGAISGTGTAVLLDRNSELWLYNSLNAVDPWWEGVSSTATLVTAKGGTFGKNVHLEVVESYKDAEFVATNSSDDDDE